MVKLLLEVRNRNYAVVLSQLPPLIEVVACEKKGLEALLKQKAPVCWNWQTRQTQNLLWVTTCGFKSRHRHF